MSVCNNTLTTTVTRRPPMAGRPALRLIGPLLLLLVREGAPLLATTHRPVRQLRQLASGQHGAPRLRMQQEWEGQPRKQRRGDVGALGTSARESDPQTRVMRRPGADGAKARGDGLGARG